ncbi:glycine zipper family protein [Cereibacter sphaeroides]|uniref:glycine zipper family protein n=1 Tax=Cereibacter sphaeroides TaxID=1063 RepID=UPI003FCD713B
MRTLTLIAIAAALALAACEPVQKLEDYRPVVDPEKTNAQKYEKDLAACRGIALKLEADYKARQEKELGKQMAIGILTGVVLGAAVGHNTGYQGDYVAAGAVAGAAAGAGSGDYTHDLVTYGPRRVVDRCMSGRGHVILNDIGRG